MVVDNGFKQTEFGIIPEDWEVKAIGSEIDLLTGFPFPSLGYSDSGIRLLRCSNIKRGVTDWSEAIVQYWPKITPELRPYILNDGDIVIAMDGSLVGKSFARLQETDLPAILLQRVARIRSTKIYLGYLKEFVCSEYFTKYCDTVKTSSAIPHISPGDIKGFRIPIPPTITEQTAIANALSDIGELIAQTEMQIEKKKAIKQGVMQELLRPKEGWLKITIDQCCDILNNLRQPLNDSERQKMKGDIPYCGANGVVDFINEYLTDEDIILMAEDGGYFDEYKTRPIAYRMSGKCWVNNHAHILRAKMNFNQDFIYYSVVHKNILDYINGGTRAKLNKSELKNIEIFCPVKSEQDDISKILSDIDLQITALEIYLVKLKLQKQGMMQVLLTGKIRLIK